MGGQALEFSESDLQATVGAYDPAKHEAPLVVGHPQHDLPAYGWVQSLQFNEGGIDATPAQVNTDFADMVAAGAFKKISASFYSPSSPSNPVPGVYYLRHVGFLGAQPPAVKGLRNPSFADTEEGVVTFSEWDDATNAGLWRNLREWFIGTHGAEVADKVLPNYEVRALELGAQDDIREAAVQAATVQPPAFTEPQPEEPTVTLEEKAALEAENTRLRAELAANRAAQVNAANVAFCERLTGLPVDARAVMVQTFNHFDALSEPLEFGEGEARAPLVAQLKAVLVALPPLVQFGESATRDRAAAAAPDATADDVRFAEANTDPARMAEHNAIRAYAAKHNTTYEVASVALLTHGNS